MKPAPVVVTGLGAVTPLGSSVKKFWQGLLAGRSGIRRITLFDASHLPCQIAGEVPDFDPLSVLERKEVRRMPRSAQMAVVAANESVCDAGLSLPFVHPERVGVVFGTGIGGLDVFVDGIEVLRQEGVRRVNPFSVPAGLPNMPAFSIARQFQCLGPNTTTTTACATGTQTIGQAMEWIRNGKADVVIAGGVEAVIRDFSIGGFAAMRALPTSFNQQPEQASRPFDALREGFVFSEGAGAVVLESLAHAQARKAHIYAEIAGYATSADGFHMAAIDPQAAGGIRAMRWALADAGVSHTEVDYVSAHGTSTTSNDRCETFAIKEVFGKRAHKIPVSSIKSMIGHPMGAAGTLEAIASTLAIIHGWLPPTINYQHPDAECDLDYVPNQARKQNVDVVLSNSFGLGGQNACLVIKRFSS